MADTQAVFEQPLATHPAAAPFLHVANGTCTTRLIALARIPGMLSIWADPLHDGPVPGGLTDDELVDVRSRHLAGAAATVDPVNDLRRWRRTIDNHESYHELILWFEHDLFDQLNLIQLLDWIRQRLPAAKPVSLVCIDTFPGRPTFKGLGELASNELASLFDTRQRVGDAEYQLAERAWLAFRDSSPEALDRLRHGDTAALPYLAAAVARFLQEFPWTIDGLSRSERRVLQLAEAGPVDLISVWPRMHIDEDAYYITDTSVIELAEALSRTSPPLLTLLPGPTHESRWLQGSVALTAAGRAVLGRQLDKVASCGIDRWLGGVHLVGGGELWRWDDGLEQVTRSPK